MPAGGMGSLNLRGFGTNSMGGGGHALGGGGALAGATGRTGGGGELQFQQRQLGADDVVQRALANDFYPDARTRIGTVWGLKLLVYGAVSY